MGHLAHVVIRLYAWLHDLEWLWQLAVRPSVGIDGDHLLGLSPFEKVSVLLIQALRSGIERIRTADGSHYMTPGLFGR